MQSLTQLPPRQQRELASFVERMRVGLGDNLYCLAVYGSAVRGAFDAQRSDLNLLLVLEASTREAQSVIRDGVTACKVTIAPFVVDRALLPRAARAFAVKFASIARAHRVLHGVDVLQDLQVDTGIARFLVEQALLNARLRTVQAFIRSSVRSSIRAGRARESHYAELAVAQVPALITEMSELLRLKGESVPDAWTARVLQLARAYDVAAADLTYLLQLREAKPPSAAREVELLHRVLLAVLDAAVARCIASNLRAEADVPGDAGT